jgi:signal transduction histidine kinase/ligand-binding sensor domain-containing protein
MKRKHGLLLYVFLSSLLHPGFAQENALLFSSLDSLNGSPLGKITGICQDQQGNMWFCGQERQCVYRFDGVVLSSLRHNANNPNSLGVAVLETIYVDKQGIIWIGGSSLDQYNPATGVFKHFLHKGDDSTSLAKSGITSILKDSKGNIWIGTFDGLDCLNEKTGKFTHYHHDKSNPKSLSNNTVNVIYEDRRGAIWIGTGFPWLGGPLIGGLNRMEPDGTFTRFTADPQNPQALVNGKIEAIFEDSKNNFWIGTSDEGLHRMDREKGTFERCLYDPEQPAQLSAPAVNAYNKADCITFICEDKLGAIWIGSYMEGLSRFDPATRRMSRYRMGNGFPDSSTYRGFVGNDGTLWVATEISKLLYRADPASALPANTPVGKRVFGIRTDPQGSILICTEGLGLLQFDKNKKLMHQFKHSPADPNTIPCDSLNFLLQLPAHDSIYICTQRGIAIMNTATNSFSPLLRDGKTTNIRGSVINAMADDQNNLWIGTDGEGLFRYSRTNGKLKQWLPDPTDAASITSDKIAEMIMDKQHDVWIGTFGDQPGICKFNKAKENFTTYLPGISAACLFEDHDGMIWAGTNNGLFKYDRKKDSFSLFFDEQTGVRSTQIFGIREDRKHNLWVATPSSIIKMDPARSRLFLMAKKFGIPYQSISPGSLFVSNDDQIYVGNTTGFYSFAADGNGLGTASLRPVVTDLFFSTATGVPGKDSALQASAEYKNKLELAHDQNYFGFKFDAYDYRSAEPIRYYTMLENYDPVWHQSSADRSVYYYNLPPGDYSFHLKAINAEQQEGEKQIQIHISPPWWRTWAAYISYLLVLGAIVYAIYRYNIRRLRISQAEQIKIAIQTQEEERKRISRDLHDDIGTKLSALKLLLSSVKDKAAGSDNRELRSLAQNSEQFISEVVGDLRQLLRNLSPSILEEFGYVVAIEGLANKINLTGLIHFNLNVFGFKQRLQKDYELSLYRITQELINNVLKHAQAKNIFLQVGLRDETITIMIEDDGKGFDLSAHKEGYGIKNMETRTKLLSGRIHIESTPGKGTVVLIEIPYNQK